MKWLLLVALVLNVPAVAGAQDFPAHTGKVNDFAAVLTPAERADLEQRLANLERSTSAEVAVVTIPTLDGRAVEEYATGLFNAWGIGKQGRDNGVLVLVAVNDRAMRIEVGYGLEGVLPDGLSGAIIRETFLPKFRDGDYRGGLLAGAARVIDVVQRNETLTPEERARLDAAARDVNKSWGFAAFLAVFVGTGAFTAGTAAGARVVVQLLFGICFAGAAIYLSTHVAPRAAVVALALLALAVFAWGLVLGRRPSWKRSMRGTGAGSGWVATGAAGSSSSSSGGRSSGSSGGGSGGSFGGGRSGGGGASGRW